VVAGTVGADRASFIVGDHQALIAVLHVIAKAVDCCSEMMHVLSRLLQKVKRQTQSTAASHTRQGAYCIYSLFKKL
jgi:hypothetical protein